MIVTHSLWCRGSSLSLPTGRCRGVPPLETPPSQPPCIDQWQPPLSDTTKEPMNDTCAICGAFADHILLSTYKKQGTHISLCSDHYYLYSN